MARLTINRIIVILIASSFFIEAGFGFMAPILAIFITDNIVGGTIAVAGFAAAIYWVVKSILQIPIAYYLDKKAGEYDDLIALIAGNFIFATGLFLYLLASTTLHLYLIQTLLAVGGALAVPSWYGMFIRHIDRQKEDLEWSINSSLSFGLGTGIAGAIGGLVANSFGFNSVFILAGIFSIVSALVLIPLYKYLKVTNVKA